MYDFRDLNKYNGTDNVMASEALNWNGEFLDRKISGFSTLNVEGRENFSRTINAPEKVGDGNLYLDSRFESKIMTVNFQLLADSGTQLQDRFDRLKNWIYRPERKFYFADEPLYYYIGTVSKIENTKAGQLNILGTIEITCSDPFKRTKAVTVTNSKINDTTIVFDHTPNTLTFVPDSNADKVQIATNDGMKITVNRGISAGQIMTVDFNNLTVKYDSTSVLIDLDLKSNLGDFYIRNGTAFTTNVSGKLTIEYEVIRI